MTEIATRVAGIPCRARLTWYQPEVPAITTGPADRAEPGIGEDIEFAILDRNGRPAAWLERKLSDPEWEKIAGELLAAMGDEHAELC